MRIWDFLYLLYHGTDFVAAADCYRAGSYLVFASEILSESGLRSYVMAERAGLGENLAGSDQNFKGVGVAAFFSETAADTVSFIGLRRG